MQKAKDRYHNYREKEEAGISNINGVIMAVLNLLLFFYEKSSHAKKSTKKHPKHKKHKNATKQKHKTQIRV